MIRRSAAVKTLAGVLPVLVGGLLAPPAAGQPVPGTYRKLTSPAMAQLWADLDAARLYRDDFHSGLQDVAVSYSTLLLQYEDDAFGVPNETPRQTFGRLIDDFAAQLGSYPDQAGAGMVEALNEHLAGEMALANQRLHEARMSRFPNLGLPRSSTDPTLLYKQAQDIIYLAIQRAVDVLRDHRQYFRRANLSSQYSFAAPNLDVYECGPASAPALVGQFCDPDVPPENCSCSTLQSSDTENDFYRVTHLVLERAIIGNETALKEFFYAFDEDDEILDRRKSAALFGASATETYLNAVLLAATQSVEEYRENNGFELKEHVADAQQNFSKINAGVVPIPPVQNSLPFAGLSAFTDTYSLAANRVSAAITAEAAVNDLSRDIEQYQTQFADRLESIRQSYLSGLGGVGPIVGMTATELENTYDLDTPSGRDEVIEDARLAYEVGSAGGDLGAAITRRSQLLAEARHIQLQISQVPARIRRIERIQGKIYRLEVAVGTQRAALELANTLADAFEVHTGTLAGITQKPLKYAAAGLASAFSIYEAVQRAEIGNLQAQQQVKDLLLEQALLAISLEELKARMDGLDVEVDNLFLRLEENLRGYAASNENLAQAYFANPAYALMRAQAAASADGAFRDAIVSAYDYARALEYEWNEDFQNPYRIRNADGTTSLVPLSQNPETVPLKRAESVFSVRSAGAIGEGQPNLSDFMSMLQAWDTALTNNRGSDNTTKTEIWSLQKLILGIDQHDAIDDPEFARLAFQDYVRRNSYDLDGDGVKNSLLVEFPVQIGTSSLIEFSESANDIIFNTKLTEIGLEWRAPVKPFEPDTFQEVFAVGVAWRGDAWSRRFFASPQQDNISTVPLATTSSFSQTVEPAVNTTPAVLTPAAWNLSPAVSRWQIILDETDFPYAYLPALEDIVLHVKFRYGNAPPGLPGTQ